MTASEPEERAAAALTMSIDSRSSSRGCSASALAGSRPDPVVQRVQRSSPSARSSACVSSESCAAVADTSELDVRGEGPFDEGLRPAGALLA